MIYFLFNNGKFVHFTTESPWTGTPKMKEFDGVTYDTAKCTPDFNSFDEVEKLAEEVSAHTGKKWIPFDNGDHTSHRFGVMEIPMIGDEVSRGFNGDYYPCGKIVKITPTLRVTTEDGTKFSRVRETASWRQIGRGFYMVAGVHDERNPHF